MQTPRDGDESERLALAFREALDAQVRVSPIILTSKTGRPFEGSNFRHYFGRAMKAAGLSSPSYEIRRQRRMREASGPSFFTRNSNR